MSAKNLDKHDRFRCITVGFRVSPEEHETINRIVALSGLTKQEYCYRKCIDREIIVEGNPRVYKALKVELAAVLDELKRIESGGNVRSGQLLHRHHGICVGLALMDYGAYSTAACHNGMPWSQTCYALVGDGSFPVLMTCL